MNILNNFDAGVLFVRAGISFLYLYAAYRNSRDKASIQWTIDTTTVLFRNTKYQNNAEFIRLCTYVGIVLMYLGGISVLLGIEGRTGALMLALFTIGGTVIHPRQQMDAQRIALENASDMKVAAPAWSAFAAHFANVLKNICLILVLIFIILCGTGKYQVSDALNHLFNSN